MKNIGETIEYYLEYKLSNSSIRCIYNKVNYGLRNFIQIKLTNEKRNHHLSFPSILKKCEN